MGSLWNVLAELILKMPAVAAAYIEQPRDLLILSLRVALRDTFPPLRDCQDQCFRKVVVRRLFVNTSDAVTLLQPWCSFSSHNSKLLHLTVNQTLIPFSKPKLASVALMQRSAEKSAHFFFLA
ncbi:TPA: hypothetical protein U8P38_003183 [Legionella pneumophila]|nr:hypothetical protein [Legionella pneumophila]